MFDAVVARSPTTDSGPLPVGEPEFRILPPPAALLNRMIGGPTQRFPELPAKPGTKAVLSLAKK